MWKNKIGTTVSLMTIVLLLIVSFQVVWINSLFHEESMELQSQVHSTFSRIPQYLNSSNKTSEHRLTADEFEGNQFSDKSFQSKKSDTIEPKISVNTLSDSINYWLESTGLFPYTSYVIEWPTDSTEIYTKGALDKDSSYRLNFGFNNQDFVVKYAISSLSRLTWQRIRMSLLASILMLVMAIGAFLYALRTLHEQQQLARLRKEMTNSLAHELKSPVTSISLAIEAIQNLDYSDDQEKMKKLLRMAKAESNHLNEMIDNVLMIAAADNQKLFLKCEEVDLHEVLKDLESHIAVSLMERKGKVNFNFQSQSLVVKGDKLHLQHSFLNIIENAIKYSEKPPDIEVSTLKDKGEITVLIKDNGVGISSEDIQKVFDRFYRVNISNGTKGFGLGLNYVKTIVEQHKGAIELSSVLGQGSIFKISLPGHV